MTTLLGLDGANSRISITSIASFAANTNPGTAYRQFCEDLDKVGVTEEMIHQSEDNILEILGSQGMVASGDDDGSNIEDQDDLELETAYVQFCEGLYRAGMTEALMPPKDEILKMLKSRDMDFTSFTSGDEGLLLEACCSLLTYVQPLTYPYI